MKKFTTLLITLCLAMSIMTACGKPASNSTESGETNTTESTETEATKESEETENFKDLGEKVGEGAKKGVKYASDADRLGDTGHSNGNIKDELSNQDNVDKPSQKKSHSEITGYWIYSVDETSDLAFEFNDDYSGNMAGPNGIVAFSYELIRDKEETILNIETANLTEAYSYIIKLDGDTLVLRDGVNDDMVCTQIDEHIFYEVYDSILN